MSALRARASAALILVLAASTPACNRGRPPASAPDATLDAAPATPPVMPAPPAPPPDVAPDVAHLDAGADAGESPLAALDHDRVRGGCFAWSPTLHAVACVTFDLSIQEGSSVRVESAGGDTTGQTFEVYSREGYNVTDPDHLEQVEEPVRRAAHEYLQRGGFAPWTAPPSVEVRRGVFADLGGLRFRRRRRESFGGGPNMPPQYDDHVELRCEREHRWAEVNVLTTNRNLGGATITATLLPDGRALLQSENHWGEEGDQGQSFDVAVVDPRVDCATPVDGSVAVDAAADASRGTAH
jgi:hypothetical protein